MATEARARSAFGVLIVDDEPPARERLERLIAELPSWQLLGSCGSAREALERVGTLQPRVVLLDIRMPGMTGLEAARHLNALAEPPAVVFTTAYDEYALAAFDAHAVDYLLKPVRRERLRAALDQAARLTAAQLAGMASAPEYSARRTHIAVRVRERLKLIALDDVLYFRADSKYVTVCHVAGEDLLDESLRQLEEEFAERFVRVHRSVLVSTTRIAALERGEDGVYWLTLRDHPETLPVSRRQLAELKRRLRRP